MGKVNPSYEEVSKSGVASQPDGDGAVTLNPYSTVSKGGVSTADQPDAPPFPKSTPADDRPYGELNS